jgi:hypothetical protein
MYPIGLIKLSIFNASLRYLEGALYQKWIFSYAYIIFYNLVTTGTEIQS